MKNIQKAREVIQSVEAIIITAGAGMGVDSGLPDFRGDEGFWKAYPPIKKLGLSFAQMANPQWFEKDPYFAWGFYGHRLELYRKTIPHKGFELLLELVKEKNDNYFIFTSNVDGQFQKAGFDKQKIYEVHGSIHHLQCTIPCSDEIWQNDEEVEIDMQTLKANKLIYCKKCGAVARPNILMFGDWHYIAERAFYQEKKLHNFLMQNKDKKTLIIEMGAGTAIPTIRNFGDKLTKKSNFTLIRINPTEAQVPVGGIGIDLGAKEAIKMIVK